MIRINLLPHRELKRAARQKQFVSLSVLITILAGLIVLAVHITFDAQISHQGERNKFLQDEIAVLDKQIEEIKVLKDQIQALLARKQVVETLQGNRAEVVHLLDQLVRQLPDGVYLKAVKQTGNVVNLNGYAQSNARVSTLMRNLEASPWLEAPNLIEIKSVLVNNQRLNEFNLNVRISRAKSDDDKGKPTTTKGAQKPKEKTT